MSIRLMICDDHLAIRLGLEAMFAGSEVEIASYASSCADVVRLASSSSPDVVLLDVRLGNDDGLEALEEVKRWRPTLPVLIFSVSDDLNDIARAHRLGADGYVLKSVSNDELLRTIHRAAAGKNAWSITQIRRVKSRGGIEAGEQRKRVPLSKREQQVLDEIIRGTSSNEMIAENMGIDIETVKQYVRGILQKLHVEDRTQAALWGLQHSLGKGSDC